MKRIFIKVEGIVQGVGFRPYVYKIAQEYSLTGWVNNNSEGVYIDIEGEEKAVEDFVDKLKNNPSPLVRIENITIENRELMHYRGFEIKKSERKDEKITLISPDMGTCSDCIKDIKDPQNRRYKYPFTNCTNCGPRFSIIKSIPYDRDKTTMDKFIMCNECSNEYSNPLDRRFHAQPNACSKCGPALWIEDSKGNYIKFDDPIEWTKENINLGKIFAVKGIGGFHLACNAKNKKTVDELRNRKKRPHKPLAVMMKDIETVKKYCYLEKSEEKLLLEQRRPIVLLKKKENCSLPDNIAPNQNTLGVMLPYTPLHELLFENDIEVLIMTSANINGFPIEFENESALRNLGGIVDYFLIHNRDIFIPIDDSVVKVVNNKPRMIRRARGYAPEPVKKINSREILACGANMLNTFGISKEGFVFLSQHNGDLENLETYEHYERNIEHFKNIFGFNPQYICCDMHEGYMSTQYAKNYNKPVVMIQHHHAHICSCMAENDVEEKVIGVAFDGTGYGIDGKIWGSEFLICDYNEFTRKAHLDYVKMPGGDMAVKEPWRMAVSYIYKVLKDKLINDKYSYDDILLKLYGEKSINIVKAIESNINSPETSSMGRLFDSVASIIGLSDKVTYEGQAAMELEALIEEEGTDSYSYEILNKDKYVIDISNALYDIVFDAINGVDKKIISLKFHNMIVNFTIEMCNRIRKESNINKVALSGGVFQNAYLLKKIIEGLEKDKFIVYTHKNVPCNDGGIALGQIMICNASIS